MERWRKVWRGGLVPLLSTAALEALQKALEDDDPRLLQGVVTSPGSLQYLQDWPVEAACLLGFCGWQGEGLKTVGEVLEFFGKICWQCEAEMSGTTTACGWFLNWFDETPRDEMRRELLPEVNKALFDRRNPCVEEPECSA